MLTKFTIVFYEYPNNTSSIYLIALDLGVSISGSVNARVC